MKTAARVITGSVRAKAGATDGGERMMASGQPLGVGVTAGLTEGRGYYKPIRVSPEEPQMLMWLNPQYGIDYRIITNLDWQII